MMLEVEATQSGMIRFSTRRPDPAGGKAEYTPIDTMEIEQADRFCKQFKEVLEQARAYRAAIDVQRREEVLECIERKKAELALLNSRLAEIDKRSKVSVKGIKA